MVEAHLHLLMIWKKKTKYLAKKGPKARLSFSDICVDKLQETIRSCHEGFCTRFGKVSLGPPQISVYLRLIASIRRVLVYINVYDDTSMYSIHELHELDLFVYFSWTLQCILNC